MLFVRAAQRTQHFQQLRQAFLPRAAGSEARGDLVDRERDWVGIEDVGEGADLVDGVFGPRHGLCDECGGRCAVLAFVGSGVEAGLLGVAAGFRGSEAVTPCHLATNAAAVVAPSVAVLSA
jgi:hypothetical protein